MQVREAFRESSAQRPGPRRELACLYVINLDAVVGEAENEQSRGARYKSERVGGLREGWEGRVVSHRIKVEDVRAHVVISGCEPLAVRTYGHARDCDRQGFRMSGPDIDIVASRVRILCFLSRVRCIHFVVGAVSSC